MINGVEMVVVGELDRAGVLEGIDYVNVTRSVGQMDEGSLLSTLGGWLAMALAILLGAIGLMSLLVFSVGTAMDRGSASVIATFLVLALIFWGLGRQALRRAKRLRTAVRMINDESLKGVAKR